MLTLRQSRAGSPNASSSAAPRSRGESEIRALGHRALLGERALEAGPQRASGSGPGRAGRGRRGRGATSGSGCSASQARSPAGTKGMSQPTITRGLSPQNSSAASTPQSGWRGSWSSRITVQRSGGSSVSALGDDERSQPSLLDRRQGMGDQRPPGKLHRRLGAADPAAVPAGDHGADRLGALTGSLARAVHLSSLAAEAAGNGPSPALAGSNGRATGALRMAAHDGAPRISPSNLPWLS